MTLEDDLAKVFKVNNWTWSIKGKGNKVPDDGDIEKALDEAARMLYAEPEGSRLEVGRLIITKTHRGHDVYVFAGTYE